MALDPDFLHGIAKDLGILAHKLHGHLHAERERAEQDQAAEQPDADVSRETGPAGATSSGAVASGDTP